MLPDLIVHGRGQAAVQANLLMLEAKKSECADRAVDYDKLRSFRIEFGYRVAVYLELPPYPNPPEWLWVERWRDEPA